METYDFLEIAQERKYRTRSLMYTSLLALLMYLLFYLVPAIQLTLPYPEREPYRTVGMIDFSEGGPGSSGELADFGNEVEGSGEVNNFLEPVKDPEPEAQVRETVKQESAPSSAPVEGSAGSVTQTDESPIKATAPKPGPVAKEEPKEETPPIAQSDPRGTFTAAGTTGRAGSNHGSGDQVGNRGSAEARTLDPRGSFGGGGGEGFEGLGTRGVINADRPSLRFDSEGRVRYRVVISPEGRVLAFEAVSGQTPGLRQPSRDARDHVLRAWRFEPVDPSRGNEVCYYTITYKLS